MVFDQAAFSLLTISYNCQLVNWRAYNESLVRRGEVMLDFDVVDGWEKELEKMNEGKVGEPYHYPESFVQLLCYCNINCPRAEIYMIEKVSLIYWLAKVECLNLSFQKEL